MGHTEKWVTLRGMGNLKNCVTVGKISETRENGQHWGKMGHPS